MPAKLGNLNALRSGTRTRRARRMPWMGIGSNPALKPVERDIERLRRQCELQAIAASGEVDMTTSSLIDSLCGWTLVDLLACRLLSDPELSTKDQLEIAERRARAKANRYLLLRKLPAPDRMDNYDAALMNPDDGPLVKIEYTPDAPSDLESK